MIGRLSGKLVYKQPPVLLIDVNGVGYELEAPMTTFYKLPEVGQSIVLHTHLVVREDAHVLYGFAEEEERQLFRTLIKVNGIGPKLALTILSSMEPMSFVQAIQENNIVLLTKIPGIGKKTAERIVIEMRDRLKNNTNANKSDVMLSSATFMVNSPTDDAVNALVALGYKPQEASQAVHKVAAPEMSSEVLIRTALQNMVN